MLTYCHELPGEANRTSKRKRGDMRNMEYMEAIKEQTKNGKVKILYYLHQQVTWAPIPMNNLFSEGRITPTTTKTSYIKLSNHLIPA